MSIHTLSPHEMRAGFRSDINNAAYLAYFDPFVFSSDWRNEHALRMLQDRGNHRDPEFMWNIARDAITYDPFTRSFPWRN